MWFVLGRSTCRRWKHHKAYIYILTIFNGYCKWEKDLTGKKSAKFSMEMGLVEKYRVIVGGGEGRQKSPNLGRWQAPCKNRENFLEKRV